MATGPVLLGREDRDREVEQQRQAEAQQSQRYKGDARPQDVEAEVVGHPGADAEDHSIATVLAKTLFHFFPFDPGAGAGVIGRTGRWSDDQTAEFGSIRADSGQEHQRAVERSNRGDRVAFERFGVEVSHFEILSFPPIRTIRLDANTNAGGVPISFSPS